MEKVPPPPVILFVPACFKFVPSNFFQYVFAWKNWRGQIFRPGGQIILPGGGVLFRYTKIPESKFVPSRNPICKFVLSCGPHMANVSPYLGNRRRRIRLWPQQVTLMARLEVNVEKWKTCFNKIFFINIRFVLIDVLIIFQAYPFR
jgi:hypothetical protein